MRRALAACYQYLPVVVLLLVIAAPLASVVAQPTLPTLPTAASIMDPLTEALKNGSAAEGKMTTRDASGNVVRCADLPQAKNGVLLGQIVPCITATISSRTTVFSAQMIAKLKPLLNSFIFLVVVLFGVRVLQGEPQIHKQGFLLLVKIAIVGLLLSNIPNTYAPAMFKIVDESVGIVTNAVSGGSLSCEVTKFKGPQTAQVWAMMDCVLGKLFGFTVGSGGQPKMVLAASMFGLATGFFFSGIWGVVMMIAIIGVLVSAFMLVIRVVVAVVSSYLIIAIIIIISPLIMPLIFLRGTQAYFEPLWKNLIAAILVPVISAAYAMIALLLLDDVLLGPNSKVKVLFDATKISAALEGGKKACDARLTSNTEGRVQQQLSDPTRKPTLAEMNDEYKQKVYDNPAMSIMTGANNACMYDVPDFNLSKVNDPEFKKKQTELFRTLMENMLEILLVCFLIRAGQTTLDRMTPMLVGGSAASTAYAHLMGFEQQLAQRGNVAANNLKEAMYKTEKLVDANRNPIKDKDGQERIIKTGIKTGAEFLSTMRQEGPKQVQHFLGIKRE